jgi:hypothetical protein
VKVHPPPFTVTVVVDDLLASVAVSAFGLVDEAFAGMEMLVGVALVTVKVNAFVEL